MTLYSVTQKLQPTQTEPILGLVTGSTFSIWTVFSKVMSTHTLENSKLNDIKYFHFVDVIRGFAKLKSNWDSYNADVISTDSITVAERVLNYIKNEGILSSNVSTHVFPMRDGGIQFEFDAASNSGELEIKPSGEMIFILFNDEGDILNHRTLVDLSELSVFMSDLVYA